MISASLPSTSTTNVRRLVARMDYIQSRVRRHVTESEKHPRGIGSGMVGEAAAIAWAIDMLAETMRLDGDLVGEIDDALDRHEDFMAEMPQGVKKAIARNVVTPASTDTKLEAP